jgi:hypothetical protein
MSRWKPGKVTLWAVLLAVAMGSGKMDRTPPAPPALPPVAANVPEPLCSDSFGDPVSYLVDELYYNVTAPPPGTAAGPPLRLDELPPLPREFWPESDRKAAAPR